MSCRSAGTTPYRLPYRPTAKGAVRVSRIPGFSEIVSIVSRAEGRRATGIAFSHQYIRYNFMDIVQICEKAIPAARWARFAAFRGPFAHHAFHRLHVAYQVDHVRSLML